MKTIIKLTETLPFGITIGVSAFTLVVIAGLITLFLYKRKVKNFTKYLEESLVNNYFSKNFYSEKFIGKHSRILENLADRKGNAIILNSGLDTQWLQQLIEKPREKNIKRILKYIPDKGLFSCFISSLNNPKLTSLLTDFLGDEPGSLRQLPLSSSGEPFDGNAALLIFKDRIDEIREMAGDPEWPVRYFAIKLLLAEDSDRSNRAILEAFKDPHPLIRKTVIEECNIKDSSSIYRLLREQLLDDSSFEVRKAANNRIKLDFSDIHKIDYSDLDTVQSLHALEFLNPENEDDIDTALNFLSGDDLELRFPSAEFLQKTGLLSEMLNNISFKDSVEMKRKTNLLLNAVEVKITGFLKDQNYTPATLYTALSILKKAGNREFISPYADKVFQSDTEIDKKIWETAVECIRDRGDENAFIILIKELNKVKYNIIKTNFILENLPKNIEHLSFNSLLKFLKDDKFEARKALIEAMSSLSEDIVIPELFKILQGGREFWSHRTRISALQVLAKYKLPYCIQPIIEQLPTLPVKEAKEFSALLTDFAGEIFNSRVLKLLKQPDGKVRAAVIASLPGSGKKEFLKSIKEALSDADPDVRIASIWALVDYEESKTLNQSINMLRDPVPRVRIAAAETIGKFASSEKLNSFSELLNDENEVIEVKKSAIIGLSKSSQNKAIDILVELIDQNDELGNDVIKALADNPSRKTLGRIIENIKDANPVLRDKMMGIFKLMGESGEEALKKLLEEDISSLKEPITEILEESGYVEHVIRKLSHRDPHIRQTSAEFLSMLGTKSAFRGIVLAARDPDQDVRVKVTRALEKLASKSGEEILEALKNDPDKRVRKFTLWAMARTKAKRIDD